MGKCIDIINAKKKEYTKYECKGAYVIVCAFLICTFKKLEK